MTERTNHRGTRQHGDGAGRKRGETPEQFGARLGREAATRRQTMSTQNLKAHYVPTSVKVTPASEGMRAVATFETEEGYEVNLYLPADIASWLSAGLTRRDGATYTR